MPGGSSHTEPEEVRLEVYRSGSSVRAEPTTSVRVPSPIAATPVVRASP